MPGAASWIERVFRHGFAALLSGSTFQMDVSQLRLTGVECPTKHPGHYLRCTPRNIRGKAVRSPLCRPQLHQQRFARYSVIFYNDIFPRARQTLRNLLVATVYSYVRNFPWCLFAGISQPNCRPRTPSKVYPIFSAHLSPESGDHIQRRGSLRMYKGRVFAE